jgi:CO/xanthine dehydrogenase Mo-binding subunit
MNKENLSFSRRSILQGSGALIVAFSIGNSITGGDKALAQADANEKPPLHPSELDNWIAIDPDGMVTVYFGKIDGGQGTDAGVAQMVAEELDIPFSHIAEVVMGDTALTCDQGGASGSFGIRLGGIALRHAAAEARLILVERAAAEWGVSADQLHVTNGIVSDGSDPSRQISYGEIVGGNYFHEKLEWNGIYGNNLGLSGRATPKSPDQYTIVGRDAPRFDVKGKVFGTTLFSTDVRVEGMLHGRMIRPPNAGTRPLSVDEASIAHIEGAQVVHRDDLIGVVAKREWDAIRASTELAVTWSEPRDVFPEHGELYSHISDAEPSRREVVNEHGSIENAFAVAAHIVEAEYEWPFQSHASMGPGCAIADVREDGVTLWTGSQKPHAATEGVAAILGVPVESVRGVWNIGPGSYGRNDGGDVAMDAAIMSQEVGRPVRVQWMRHEGTGWDPKGPSSIHRARAAVGTDGNIIAWDFLSKGFSRVDTNSRESEPKDTLAGQLLGMTGERPLNFRVPENAYEFEHARQAWETIPTLLEGASPLRTSHLRDPVGPEIHFACESFMDEVAQAVNADPVEFRLRYVTEPRHRAVIETAAERGGWVAGPAGTRQSSDGDVMRGKGIAYAERAGTIVAIVADVEVNQRTGRIWARHITVAHDCGQIINPRSMKTTIEGNVVQGLSRALHEEVLFNPRSVTSVDWVSYPILSLADAPETVDIVLIDHPEIAPRGAGESTIRIVAAAVANAVYEATGTRLRRGPLNPARVRASFS